MKTSAVLAVLLAVLLVSGCVSPPSVGVTSSTLGKPGKSVDTQGATAKPAKDGSSLKQAEVLKPPPSNNVESDCNGISDQRLRNICFRDAAVKAGKADLCVKIDQDNVRDDCLYKVARNTNDKGVCSRISQEAMRDICESS